MEVCSFPAACSGAPNPAFFDKFFHDGTDLAKRPPLGRNETESCGTGYRKGAFLCGACATGYSFSDLSGSCGKCPSRDANVAVGTLGVLAGLIGLAVGGLDGACALSP